MMKVLAAIGFAASLLCAQKVALAQDTLDFGKAEFESRCASCHGQSGKGDGPLSRMLMTKPADLTTMAKKNGGVFPAQRAYEIIDGRQYVEAHGTREMPVWGKEYEARTPDLENYTNLRSGVARSRILALIDYLYRLQAK